MKRNLHVSAAIAAASLMSAASAQSVTTAFTYQGRVDSNGQAAVGVHDLRFRLFTPAGAQVGSTLCSDNVQVTQGTFAVSLDFGAVFTGQQLMLEIEVRPDTGLTCGDPTGFTTLAPRQAIVAAPYSLFAVNAASLNGQAASFYTNAGNITAGTIADARLGANVARTNISQSFTAAMSFSHASNVFAGSGAGLTSLDATNVSAGTLADARLSGNIARRDLTNTFAAANVFNANIGIGSAATFPLTVGGSAQTLASFTSSNTGGTWLNFANSAAGGRTWNLVSSGPGLSEGAGVFFIRDGNASSVRLLIGTDGNVGINTTTPGERLEVSGQDTTIRIRNTNDTGGGFISDTFATLQFGLYNPSAGLWGAIPANTKRSLLGLQNTGRVGTMTNTTGSPIWRNVIDDGSGNASFTGDLSALRITSFASTTTGGALSGTHLGSSNNQYGAFGLASTTGTSTAVGVRGEARGNSGTGVWGAATSTTGQAYGVVGLGVSSNTLSAGVYGESGSANGVYGYSPSGRAVYGRSDSGSGVYAQTTTGGLALYGVRTSNNNRGWFGGLTEGGSAISVSGVGFDARTTSGSFALYAERNPGGTTANVNRGWIGGAGEGGWVESDQGNGLVALSRGLNSSGVYCRNDAGGRALFADGVAAVRALDILGGADLAEPFDIAEADSPVPGMVVTIDPEQPGNLRVATVAYDTKVAGIISGANGLSPGMVMRAENGLHVDGQYPVAMTGRVWCFADATIRAIGPGDRLTTSTTPGHAMRADNIQLAPGAIIGKAMTPLPLGEKGLVLVLVNLQ